MVPPELPEENSAPKILKYKRFKRSEVAVAVHVFYPWNPRREADQDENL